METNPLVSVIIPNYNHAQYLEQRLDSVFNQTYPNFEVIILDDCSTDTSLDVIGRYKDNPHLSRIEVNETNSGSPFKQWNKGFEYAKGDLIWIAESDDFCELTLLEELVKAITGKDNVVVAFSSYVLVFDDKGEKYFPPEHKNQYFSGRQFVSKWMSMECVIKNASGAVFRKEALRGISDDYMSLRQGGDYLFWVQLAGQGNVACVNKNLSYFRIHGGSVTACNGSSSIGPMEDKRIFDYIDSHYHLSWFHKQIVYAQRYRWYCWEPDEIKQEALALWGMPERSETVDNVLLWLVAKARLHFGVLL